MEGQEYYQTGDHFFVEEFLDFSNAEASEAAAAPGFEASAGGIASSDSSTPVDSCNSAFLPDISDAQFSGDLCVPYDDVAELEWLSNIVEESFSSEDLQRLQLISGVNARSNSISSSDDPTAATVRAAKQARSKRSRGPPCNWSSRLLLLSPSSSNSNSNSNSDDNNINNNNNNNNNETTITSAAPSLQHLLPPGPSPSGKKAPRKKDLAAAAAAADSEGRRCLHCATDKTPQWRTGPMGPKTLCNACGVRYKSGRLVPEYRPAASPTFVLTKHSNSHRKVLELRRQKDFARVHHGHHNNNGAHLQQNNNGHFVHHHHHHGVIFDPRAVPSSSNGDDFLIHHHHHVGSDFRQMI